MLVVQHQRVGRTSRQLICLNIVPVGVDGCAQYSSRSRRHLITAFRRNHLDCVSIRTDDATLILRDVFVAPKADSLLLESRVALVKLDRVCRVVLVLHLESGFVLALLSLRILFSMLTPAWICVLEIYLVVGCFFLRLLVVGCVVGLLVNRVNRARLNKCRFDNFSCFFIRSQSFIFLNQSTVGMRLKLSLAKLNILVNLVLLAALQVQLAISLFRPRG